MMHQTNQYSFGKIKSTTEISRPLNNPKRKYQVRRTGSIRLILLLYQFGKLSSLPINNVYPEQKKKTELPNAPPVIRNCKLFGSKIEQCDHVIQKAAKTFIHVISYNAFLFVFLSIILVFMIILSKSNAFFYIRLPHDVEQNEHIIIR